MNHYTLNTGHNRVSPRSEVLDEIIEMCQPWLLPGEHHLPNPGGYRLVVPGVPAGWLGTVYQADVPICSIGVAANHEESAVIWSALMRMHDKIAYVGGDPVEPQPPWCSVLLIASSPSIEWLGDFERCMAWAYLERQCS